MLCTRRSSLSSEETAVELSRRASGAQAAAVPTHLLFTCIHVTIFVCSRNTKFPGVSSEITCISDGSSKDRRRTVERRRSSLKARADRGKMMMMYACFIALTPAALVQLMSHVVALLCWLWRKKVKTQFQTCEREKGRLGSLLLLLT